MQLGGIPITILKICGDNHYPPFEFLNDQGVFNGFNIELLEAIAKELKLETQFELMSWTKAVESVRSGLFDAIQGMAISPERLANFDFSEEYIVVSQSIFVLATRTDINKIKDLKNKTVAIQKGDVSYDLMNCMVKAPKTFLHYVLVEDQREAIIKLLDNKVDAFIGNQLTGTHIAQKLGKSNEIRIVGEPISPQAYAIAVKKGRKDLIDLFNSGIVAIKSNGIYDEICAKWFGEMSTHVGNQIIENVDAGVIRLNKAGTIISINSYAKKLFDFGISPLRRHYSEIPLEGFIDHNLLQDTITNGKTYFNLEVIMHQENKESVISYNLCPLYDLDSTIIGAVIAFRDVTEEKRLKESLITKDKMQSLGHLLVNIAHEVRTPLTAIKAFIEVLPMQYDNPEYRKELVHHVPAEIDRLDKLIKELLEYSRPCKANREWCNIKDIVQAVIELFQYQQQFSKRNIDISIPVNLMVWADKHHLKQIFLNLIMNAIEATKEDEGEIVISARLDQAVIINIRDNGHGISADELLKIFDPFFTTKISGTGLGLFNVYQLIKENQGDIFVESTVGGGMNIKISFPVKETEYV